MQTNETSKPSSLLDALPLTHLLILLLISALLLGIALLLPNHEAQITQKINIPEDLFTKTITIDVRPGDSFSTIANRAELDAKEVFEIMNADELSKKLLELYPGQSIDFHFDKTDQFTSLNYQSALTETLHVKKEATAYKIHLETKELITKIQFASGIIKDSLFLAANRAGLSDNLTMSLADLLGWDIDFALDIRKGDSFEVMYEELYLENAKVKNGKILSARFINQGKEIIAIHYEDSQGNSGYFTPEGLSMRKTFRRNPLDIVRISSRFNLRRKHPVLHTIRAHRGVDYAASTGTPIRATGDGKVVTARTKGGFGNTVIIQHGQKYTTLYAHLSKYGRGIREGRSVKQGQIIGYVGSTGLATGPHLHYEFRVNGVHRNPLTVSLPHAKPIAKDERENFLEHSKRMLKKFNALSS